MERSNVPRSLRVSCLEFFRWEKMGERRDVDECRYYCFLVSHGFMDGCSRVVGIECMCLFHHVEIRMSGCVSVMEML